MATEFARLPTGFFRHNRIQLATGAETRHEWREFALALRGAFRAS